MLEKGLYQLVTQDSGVSALVGTSVFFILAPKGTPLPFIVISRVTTSDCYDMDGATGFREGLFQFDCYASDFYTSRAISLAVRQLFENYRGILPGTDPVSVSAVITDKDWDMPYEEGGKGFVYRALLEFRIRFYDTGS